MRPFTTHTGRVLPLDRANVDTDAIIPKQYLKSIHRSGFGPFLFDDWRYLDKGDLSVDPKARRPNPRFVLNDPRYRDASVLLARDNFGCGSSREHAVWALGEYGFRVVIAESLADIFYANCCQNGLLPVRLVPGEMQELFTRYARADGRYDLLVDLETQTVRDAAGFHAGFSIDSYQRDMLLAGLDEIGRTLLAEARITEYENSRDGGRGRGDGW